MAKQATAQSSFAFFDFLRQFYTQNRGRIRNRYKDLTKKFLDYNDKSKNPNAYLREPQFEALEIYVFLKEFCNNPQIYDLFDKWYNRVGDFAAETVYNSLLHVIENRIEETPIGRDFVANCPKVTDKAKTNIPPRIRMTVLYAIAQTLGYRVIGTGNASEAYIGWTTKWGDSAYDFNPIAHLTCTEIMALGDLLADEFGLNKRYVTKTPSDGLCGKTDEDSFGFTYATLDGYISGGMTNTDYETALKIEQMHQASEHKRNMPATLE